MANNAALNFALADRLEQIKNEADRQGYLGGFDWSVRDSETLVRVLDYLRGNIDA